MTQTKRSAPVKNKPTKSAPQQPSSEAAPVRVHDLPGMLFVGLTAELRTIFDDEDYREIVSALESKKMTIIIRGPADIAYVHLQLVTRDLGGPVSQAYKQPKSSARQPRSRV